MASAETWGMCPQRVPGAEPLVGGSEGQSLPEAESLLAFGHPTKATKFAELAVFGKMYLLHLIVLHLCENEGCMKTTNASTKNRTAKNNQSILVSVIGANKCLGY